MRVLIYPEPHPIRNSQVLFDHVAKRLLSVLRDSDPEFDVRVYLTKALRERLGQTIVEQIEKRIMPATPDEEALFESHLVPWESDGVPAWIDLMSGGAVADDYLGVLHRLWTAFPFDVILHWAENGAITRFVQERPVTRIAMELGCTRAPYLSTIVMDPFGTNGNATVPRLSIADLQAIVGDNPMTAAEALYGYSSDLEPAAYEEQFAPLDPDLSMQLRVGQRKVAFLPLQLHDDANLLRFSPYASVEEVVRDIVPRLAEAGYLTIVKTHPGARNRPQSRLAFTLARAALAPWADDVVWLDATRGEYSNAQLVAMSDLIVTVNSSTGFEALFFDKVVVVMGDAVYKPRGLFPTLDQAISGRFDKQQYLDGIGILRRFMLGGYMVEDALLRDRSAVKDAVITIDAAARAHGNDVVGVATSAYTAFMPRRSHRARMRLQTGGSAPSAKLGAAKARPQHATETTPALGAKPELAIPAHRLVVHTSASSSAEFRRALEAALAAPAAAEEYIRIAGIVDTTFYLNTYRDVAKKAKEPVAHWSRYGIREGRMPRQGLSFASVDNLIDELVAAVETSFTSDADREHTPTMSDSPARLAAVDEVSASLRSRSSRVAVIAHLRFRDSAARIISHLENIPEPFDLIATVPSWGNRHLVEMVVAAHPDALIFRHADEPSGYETFLDFLPTILANEYDSVLNLHTSSSVIQDGILRRDLSSAMEDEVLRALLGSVDRVSSILEAMRSAPAVAGVIPQQHYVTLEQYPYPDGGVLADSLLGPSSTGCHSLGAMLWFAPAALRSLVTEPINGQIRRRRSVASNDPNLTPILSRLFSHAAELYGPLLGAPSDPSEPLVFDLMPRSDTIENHLSASVLSARRRVMRHGEGAGRG